jgi:tetratricopeptide (TPR) repeat protein
MRRHHAPAFGKPHPGLHLSADLADHGRAVKQRRRDGDVAAVGGDDGVRDGAGEAYGRARGAERRDLRLAETRPDAFLPDLAGSLNNLGGDLSNLGRREEALAASQEAVAIYRRLAETRPDAFLPALAMSLNNSGAMLSNLGRREEALAASQEAVDIRRRLAETRPDAFLPDLASSLVNLGRDLSNLGRREEALAASQEAVAIYRRLAETRPDAFLSDHAPHNHEPGNSPTMNNKRSASPSGARIPRPAHPDRREQPLPGHRPKSPDEDPDALERVSAILASPRYRLAEQDQTFFEP